jgi:hypothetical protein
MIYRESDFVRVERHATTLGEQLQHDENVLVDIKKISSAWPTRDECPDPQGLKVCF